VTFNDPILFLEFRSLIGVAGVTFGAFVAWSACRRNRVVSMAKRRRLSESSTPRWSSADASIADPTPRPSSNSVPYTAMATSTTTSASTSHKNDTASTKPATPTQRFQPLPETLQKSRTH
jgi:hypothetical protein